MPVTASVLRLAVRYDYLGQHCENVQHYHPVGAAFLTATVEGVLEAFWNDVGTVFRAFMPAYSPGIEYTSLYGEELDGGLGYAEFPIPLDERSGTRTIASGIVLLPSFMAVGFRQAVGTRVTRPGQKRFPFVVEGDVQGNDLGSDVVTLMEAAGEKYCFPVTLGAPVGTGVLHPVVLKSQPPGSGLVYQDITGIVSNTHPTSQISRKLGHGS